MPTSFNKSARDSSHTIDSCAQPIWPRNGSPEIGQLRALVTTGYSEGMTIRSKPTITHGSEEAFMCEQRGSFETLLKGAIADLFLVITPP